MTDGESRTEKGVVRGPGTKWVRGVVLIAVCVLVIGVYNRSATSGVLESIGLKAENTYYNLLVQAFRAGQLNLKAEVPPGLAQLDDPYKPAASLPYRLIYGHPLHDLSYYRGKLYLYFGITPALVLFWPYVELTGHYLLHKDAVAIFFSTGFLIGAGLLLAVWKRYFAEVSFWVIVPCLIGLGLANFTPIILMRCDVYEVAISCGYAMSMLTLAGIWQALHDPQRRGRWLALASLAYGLAVGARPLLLFGAVILLAPIIQARQEKQRIWPLLLAATVPIFLIGVGLMFYNAMRFDNPLEFGLRYQLTTDPEGTMQQFSLRYVWFNFRVAFLEPAQWTGLFPFAHDVVVPPLPKGAMPAEHPFGVLTNIPLVWLALAAPLAWRNRSTPERSTLLWFIVAASLVFGTCALTILLHFSMCIRYEVEFAHGLVLLAVIGILAVERALAGQRAWRRAARCGWGLLVIFSVAFNLLARFDVHAQTDSDLGENLAANGNLDEAIAQYQLALQLDPHYAQARNNLGNVLLEKGNLDEAIAQYQQALQADPHYEQAHINLANALVHKGKMDEAYAQYQQALQINPDDAIALNDLGNALLIQGKVDEAIPHLQQAVEIDPGSATVQNNLYKAFVREGKEVEAMPHYAEAQYDAGSALLQAGEVDKAIPHLQEALEFEPNDAEVQHDLGKALLQEGRPEEAIENYRKAIQFNPENVEALNDLAWVLATCADASLREGNEAVVDGEKACELSHDQMPVPVGTLAAAYAEAGRFPEAIATAEKAEKLAAAAGLTAVAGRDRQMLKLYQASEPYHEPPNTKP